MPRNWTDTLVQPKQRKKGHENWYVESVDRRWQSSILEVRSCWAADCDIDHYLVVAKVRDWQ